MSQTVYGHKLISVGDENSSSVFVKTCKTNYSGEFVCKEDGNGQEVVLQFEGGGHVLKAGNKYCSFRGCDQRSLSSSSGPSSCGYIACDIRDKRSSSPAKFNVIQKEGDTFNIAKTKGMKTSYCKVNSNQGGRITCDVDRDNATIFSLRQTSQHDQVQPSQQSGFLSLLRRWF